MAAVGWEILQEAETLREFGSDLSVTAPAPAKTFEVGEYEACFVDPTAWEDGSREAVRLVWDVKL